MEFFLQKPGNVNFEVFHTSGRLVKKYEPVMAAFGYHTKSIDLGGLDGGMYVIKLRTGNFMGTVQVVKQ